MKKLVGNILLLAGVTLVCLALAEAGLRVFTPFPIHGQKANKVPGPDLGYRLSTRHPSIDAHGFRNSGAGNRAVAAIGDSHTYGSGVASGKSWPAGFEKMTGVPTYNFGVSSYGVYTYYALARKAIDAGYRHVIIGLFIQNDFKTRGNACEIDYEGSPLWRKAKADLNLRLPQCGPPDGGGDEIGVAERFGRAKDLAFVSALDYLVIDPLAEWWRRFVSGRGEPAVRGAGAAHAWDLWELTARGPENLLRGQRESDPDWPATRAAIEDFEKMLTGLERLAAQKGVSLGVLFIPSKMRAAYEAIEDRQALKKFPWLGELIANQMKLEARLSAFLERHAIPSRSALPEVLAAVAREQKTAEPVYRSGDGHPQARGYRAYAGAAVKLFRDMQASRPGARQ